MARWTGVATEDERLRAHLFGTERVAFPRVLREGLADLQEGRCFYCGAPLTQRCQVDHFLAWSRWPNDAVENLVLADQCNAAKSDHLVAPEHLQRWVAFMMEHADALADLALRGRWPSDKARSGALVRSAYRCLAPGVPLWLHGKEFVVATGPVDVSV